MYFASLKIAIIRDGIQLLPEKAIFFIEEKVLVVADLHFGKINHFRQAGLPVPLSANHKNAETLIDLINYWKPARTIFLGDLFHSHYNEEWEVVGQIVNHFPACSFELVMGNHDIMSELQYQRKGIKVIEQEVINQWILTHEPMNVGEIPSGKINMAGHLHPGAFLEGKGRQSVTLPCFWFSKNRLILPAFGSFTGLAVIDPSENDNVYIVLEKNISEVKLAPSRRKLKTLR
ncbi:ligase-associated DNA damage response endonuclease PdeM [soil metagenome]